MKQQFLNDSGLTELIGYIKKYVKDDQDVKPYASLSVFPKTGEQNIIYIDTTTNSSYYWDNNTKTYKALDVQTWANLTGKPTTFPPSSHTHDDRYYTETEINTKLAAKADSSHKHVKADITDFPTSMPASDVPAWAKASSKPSYSWPEINNKPSTFTPSSHTHGSGDITSLSADKITGVISIDHLPAGALERCKIVADDTARFKLTKNDIQNGDTVKVGTDANARMYFVIDDTKLSSEAGYTIYTAGSATSVPWSGVTGKPSTFTPSFHKHTISDITNISSASVSYATSAGTATKLGTSAGSATQPVYFSDGKPVATTYTLSASVPAGAKFTDTNTWRPLGTTGDTACAGNDSRLSNARPASDVYSWAKASTKPSYSWGEITGKPSTFTPSSHEHSYITCYATNTIQSLSKDTTTEWAKYKNSIHWYTQPKYITDQPTEYGLLINVGMGKGNDVHQIWLPQPGGSIAHRSGNSSGWDSSWRFMLDSSNYTSYTVTKSGSGASGTWGINVTGSAGSVAWGNVTGRPSSLPASDVYAWAKASNKPSYTKAEVGLGNVDNTADSAKSVKYATSAGDLIKTTPQLCASSENNEITIKINDNNIFKNSTGVNNASLRNGLDFKWYDTNWQIGNIRGNSVDSIGFGFAFKADKNSALALKARIDTNGVYHGGVDKLATARNIFGKDFDGSANIAGQGLFYGTYTSTAADRYGHCGLQIRENGQVRSGQSDFGYAPSIGFHWAERIAATLNFHSDGIFYFRKQDGKSRATIDANVNGNISWKNVTNKRRCYVGQSGSTNTKPWYKFASFKTTAEYEDRRISFKVSGEFGANSWMCGILTAHLRTNANKNEEAVWLQWEYATNYIDPSKFVLIYKNTTNTSTDVELWVKIDKPYTFYHFTVLTEEYRDIFADYSWTLYNQHSAGYADAPTSGYTQVYSKVCHLANKMSMLFADGYYGMITPSGSDREYIRTTSNGLIPSKSGGARSGHSALGTSSWYFSSAYIDNVNAAASVKIGQPNNSNNGAIELYGGSPYIDFHAGGTNTDYTSRIIAYSDRIEFVFA